MILPLPPRRLVSDRILLLFAEILHGDREMGFVPGYHYRILERPSGVDVGHINFRIGDTPHVTQCAGHIGFFIVPAHRGNGYALEACRSLAGFVAQVSGEVIITVDPDNVPSKRTIEKLGAFLMDEVAVPVTDPHYQRGSRRKLRYLWRPACCLDTGFRSVM